MPHNQEPRGKGVNERIYYITTNILDDWSQLPDALPEYIVASRKFKYVFIGNLEANIYAYPFFEGKEKHLLRAQIARITHGTTICPKGLYNVNDKGDIEPLEEAAMPTFEELSAAEGWIHFQRNILMAGRITHFVEQKKDEAEREKELEELKAKDPEKDPLLGIAEDESKVIIRMRGNGSKLVV